MKNITLNDWLNGKNINSNVESILRIIDNALIDAAEDTRRGKGRISFGELKPKKSLVILFWQANGVKLQVNANHYPDYSKFGFVTPRYKEHGEKGFMEYIITEASQLNEELIKFLTKGLKL